MSSAEIATTTGPGQLLEMAVAQNLDIEKLEKLVAMQERFDEREARKAFYAALSIFQSEVPEIPKTEKVEFGTTKYSFAPLGSIVKSISPALLANGLSYRWNFDTTGEIIVSCVVTHMEGHSESTTMSAAADDSGKKNAVQGRASTITYLQRYTLIGALGLATATQDDDARSDTPPSNNTSTQPKAWTLPGVKDFTRETKFWIDTEINGISYKGEPFNKLPNSVCEKIANSPMEGKSVERVRAIEFANQEWAIRVEENLSHSED